MTKGIHHITAISSDPQKTYDFYTQILGLRLVKKTVNQDDPATYHLFFGDNAGSPGLDLTFFTFQPAYQGRRGPGMVTNIMLSVPQDSLGFWLDRLGAYHVRHNLPESSFGVNTIKFYDFDGQQLTLVFDPEYQKPTAKFLGSTVNPENQIGSFYGAELSVEDPESTIKVLNILGYAKKETKDLTTRLAIENAERGKYLDILKMTSWSEGINSSGTVHHIAFRIAKSEDATPVVQQLAKMQIGTTGEIDRYYFRSTYFREPSNVLFELATDEPGFAVDENLETLGEDLILPPKLKNLRIEVESILPAIHQKTKLGLEEFFTYKKIDITKTKEPKVLILLHGMGGNENDLINLIPKKVFEEYIVFTLRGNLFEGGILRFFRRFAVGDYDYENLKQESKKFIGFISRIKEQYNSSITALGFSNGANFIYATEFESEAKLFDRQILIHPALLKVNEQKAASNQNIDVIFSEKDQFTSIDQRTILLKAFEQSKFNIKTYKTNSGHAVSKEEIDLIEKLLS